MTKTNQINQVNRINRINRIDQAFQKKKELKLMTHVVAGYPDMETSKQLVRVMAENGADLVEIQIPFSDPLADGPTIMEANQQALDNGVTPDDCFAMAAELSRSVDIPLLFMTYVNIPYRLGMENFMSRSAEAGISGLIVPDLLFDEDTHGYMELAKRYNLYAIPVISPGIDSERLTAITRQARGFVYTTLKVGITGASRRLDPRGLAFLDTLREHTSLPIAAGFGISSAEHAGMLRGKADAAVIGSHILNLVKNSGINKVKEFLSSLSLYRSGCR